MGTKRSVSTRARRTRTWASVCAALFGETDPEPRSSDRAELDAE